MSREFAGVASGEAHYRTAFAHAPVGIVLTEVGAGRRVGTILDVNHALCALLGYERDELLGAEMTLLGHPEDLDVAIDRFQRLLEHDEAGYTVTRRLVRADGEPVWAQVTVAPAGTGAGRPAAVRRHLPGRHPRARRRRAAAPRGRDARPHAGGGDRHDTRRHGDELEPRGRAALRHPRGPGDRQLDRPGRPEPTCARSAACSSPARRPASRSPATRPRASPPTAASSTSRSRSPPSATSTASSPASSPSSATSPASAAARRCTARSSRRRSTRSSPSSPTRRS